MKNAGCPHAGASRRYKMTRTKGKGEALKRAPTRITERTRAGSACRAQRCCAPAKEKAPTESGHNSLRQRVYQRAYPLVKTNFG